MIRMLKMKVLLSLLAFMLVMQTTKAQQVTYITHVIQKGENLSSLSSQYHASVDDIKKLNGLTGILVVGQKLKIPIAPVEEKVAVVPAELPSTEKKTEEAATPEESRLNSAVKIADSKGPIHIVGKGEVLGEIAKHYNVTVSDLKEWNQLKNDIIYENQLLYLANPSAGSNATVLVPVPDAPVSRTSSSSIRETTPTIDSKGPLAGLADERGPLHIVSKGENLDKIAKRYNITVAQLKGWNNLTSDLIVENQTLYIAQPAPIGGSYKGSTSSYSTPTYSSVATSSSVTAEDKGSVHIVSKGENLYRIAMKYNVTMDDLRTWNNLKSDMIQVGQSLYVGQSGYTRKTQQQPSVSSVQNTSTTTSSAYRNTQQTTSAATYTEPVYSKPEPVVTKATPVQQPRTQSTTTSDARFESMLNEQSSINTTSSVPSSVKSTTAQTQTSSVRKPTSSSSVNIVDRTVKPAATPALAKLEATGYFSMEFDRESSGKQLKTSIGTAMVFRPLSSDNETKYYIIMNSVPANSLVKVAAYSGDGSAPRKAIVARVLWKMADVEDNIGLSFRLSSNAADALGITDSKFLLQVLSYNDEQF